MKQKIDKKLSLNKSTVATLLAKEMNGIKGRGMSDTDKPEDSCITCMYLCNTYISCVKYCPC